MTSEQLSYKCEYVQQLTFFQCVNELCDFFDVLFFHGDHPFIIRGKNTCSESMF